MLDFPNAKVNIGLHILRKESTGFHSIETLFYPIAWKDALEILPSKETQFTISGLAIEGKNEDNLCIKAYNLLKNDFNLPPIHLHLHKNIPMGAGLGGGSSDASFTLKMLNQIFSINLGKDILKDYASKLGSDCAFFIENTAHIGKNRGEILSPFALNLKGYYMVVVYPSVFISTAEAYSLVKPFEERESLETLLEKDMKTWQKNIVNDFETALFPKYKILAEIKEYLYNQGAVYASLSGSGASLFGIFEKLPQNLKALEKHKSTVFQIDI
jgi:4-diphosphocytidyl-2-C-methyl-D-erythritol kinase